MRALIAHAQITFALVLMRAGKRMGERGLKILKKS